MLVTKIEKEALKTKSRLLPLNLAGAPGGVPNRQLLDQMETMGQGPTITSVDVPYSLQTFTDGKSLDMEKIT